MYLKKVEEIDIEEFTGQIVDTLEDFLDARQINKSTNPNEIKIWIEGDNYDLIVKTIRSGIRANTGLDRIIQETIIFIGNNIIHKNHDMLPPITKKEEKMLGDTINDTFKKWELI